MLYVLYLTLLPLVVTNLEEILNEITHQHPTSNTSCTCYNSQLEKGISVLCVMFFYLQVLVLG